MVPWRTIIDGEEWRGLEFTQIVCRYSGYTKIARWIHALKLQTWYVSNRQSIVQTKFPTKHDGTKTSFISIIKFEVPMNKTPRSQHHQAGFLHVPACSWYFFCKNHLPGGWTSISTIFTWQQIMIYIYYYIYIGICGTYMENIILHINIINDIWRIYELSWIPQRSKLPGIRDADGLS